jgi:hypothetical protein
VTSLRVNVDVRNNHVYNEGVDLDHVRRSTNRTVERLSLKDANRAGEAKQVGRDLVIYKPEIKRNEAAKPRRVIDEATAERQLSSETGGRIYRDVSRREEEAIREDHDKERRLMRESQESELDAIRREGEQEKARIQNPEQKKNVESRVSSRITELKKKHEQEKAELEKRQKTEEDKAKTKKAPVKKKVGSDKR